MIEPMCGPPMLEDLARRRPDDDAIVPTAHHQTLTAREAGIVAVRTGQNSPPLIEPNSEVTIDLPDGKRGLGGR